MLRLTSIDRTSLKPESGMDSLTTPPLSAMYVPQGFESLEAWLTWWTEAFPASPSPLLAIVAEQPTKGTSGPIRRESLGTWSHDTSSLKTPQVLRRLQVTYLPTPLPYSETLPRWVTWDTRELYRLETPALPISGNAGGVWPTPDKTSSAYAGEGYGPNLRQIATMDWPTPISRDWKTGEWRQPTNSYLSRQAPMMAEAWATPTNRNHHPPGPASTQHDLGRQAPRMPMPGLESSQTNPGSPQLWRTPGQSDAEGGTMEIRPNTAGHYKLGDQVGSRKRLSPLFVEWLMGTPLGWTSLEPLDASEYRRWATAFVFRPPP